MTRNTRLRVISAATAYAISVSLAGLILAWPAASAPAAPMTMLAAASEDAPAVAEQKKLTPEQQMQKRFPHPVLVRRLIGMPVLDYDNATIGYVRQVVRSPAGKVLLIVPYSSWFGWAPTSWGKRPVAVPIEAVAILAFELAALDMMREDFDKAPTWTPSQGEPIPPGEMTLVALARR